MKLQLVLAVFCAVVLAECAAEETSTTAATTPNPKECCYPRPPRRRNLKRCCEIPLDEVYNNVLEEIKTCKEEMKKKEEHQDASTTPSPPSSSTVSSTSPSEVEEEADLAELDDGSNEIEDATPTSTTASPSQERSQHSRHHGWKNNGKHRRGKGKCVKQIMEKRGWAKDGVVNFEAILKETLLGKSAEADLWVPILEESIKNCSAQPPPEFQEGDNKKNHYVPERAAFRCIKNNAIMNCPSFPETDEYCLALREVYRRCGARKQPGRRRFEWCEGRKHNQNKEKSKN